MNESFLRVTRAELDQMLAYLFKSPQMFQLALPKLTINDFDDQLERPHKLLWAIILDYHKQYGSMLPPSCIAAEIEKRASNSQEFMSTHQVDAVYALAADLVNYDVKSGPPESYFISLLDRFMFERRVRPMVLSASEKDDITPSMIAQLQVEMSNVKVVNSQDTNPFDEEGGMFGVKPRQGLNVSFLDELLGGGVRVGDTLGCLAPSGGGKTTLANQIAINYAVMQQKHFVIFSYEQPVDNEYMVPVYACATGIPRERIYDVKSLDDFTEIERNKFITIRNKVKTFLHYIDMSGCHSTAGNGGIEEIEATLIRFKNKGMPISAFAIDWFWPMMIRRHALDSAASKKQEERVYAVGMIDGLRQMCGRQSCWCWINHQTAPASVSKSKKSNWTNSAEFKSFAWYLSGCFALNDINEESCQATINYSKARNTKRGSKVIKLLGEIATFVDVSGSVTYDKRSGQYVDIDKPGAVPTDGIGAGRVRI
jgi:hypothetical protein